MAFDLFYLRLTRGTSKDESDDSSSYVELCWFPRLAPTLASLFAELRLALDLVVAAEGRDGIRNWPVFGLFEASRTNLCGIGVEGIFVIVDLALLVTVSLLAKVEEEDGDLLQMACSFDCTTEATVRASPVEASTISLAALIMLTDVELLGSFVCFAQIFFRL